MVAFYPHYNDNSTKVLTWDGHVFTTGDNRYGRACEGWSSTNSTNDRAAENLKEHFNNGYFIQVRFPTTLTGNVDDLRGCGYGNNSDNVYAFWEYKSYDNRYYINGYGGSYMQGNSDGQYYCTPHVPILG